jgi:lysophospholipase L1-like esterase
MNNFKYLIFLFLCLSLAGFSPVKKKTTIFTIGDSTMANKDTTGNNPERGWCQVLPAFFDQTSVSIDNRAKNGRSSKSFISEGLWKQVLTDLQKGDYVFIQFGHNDSKPDSARKTDPRTTYRANLVRYITETRQKGANPVLFTSIVRRSFDEEGKQINTLSEYPAVTRELGKELNVPVIDLNKTTEILLAGYGVEGSKALFMHIEPGISKKEPYGRTDNTHLNPLGAFKVAELAVREIKVQKLPIAKFIKEDVKINTNFRGTIDREALVGRHNIRVNRIDTLASLTVGNGDFAFTTDATGMQTFPEFYEKGIPLGTQSQWGWHDYPNTEKYRLEESFQDYNFRGRPEPYAVQLKTPERGKEAGNYFRVNAHRLHLGIIGLSMTKKDGSEVTVNDISEINEELNLWKGEIHSSFKVEGVPVEVVTYCHPDQDLVSSKITSPMIDSGRLKVKFRFPYPTGNHTDDACNWNSPEKHKTTLTSVDDHSVIFGRTLDATKYFAKVDWKGTAKMDEKQAHYFELTPKGKSIEFSCRYSKENRNSVLPDFDHTKRNSEAKWSYFWNRGGAVDFSGSTDPRANELERRTVLSQYLMAIQCSGTVPPQETGLTYNSWFGKFHLEMHWWHATHFALWNRIDLLEKSLDWYRDVLPVAQSIAQRQGFKGARWMKMTDTTGLEAPSGIGSFLIWQQPHIIYFAELCYCNYHNRDILEKYKKLVFETADFMTSFATYDPDKNRYNLIGIIPAQETFNPEVTYNSPYELAYWHWGLSIAQQWRVRLGMSRNRQWDDIIEKIAVLAQREGLYLSAESAPNSYTYLPYYSDHPAVLGALGVFPESRVVDKKIMNSTFDYIWDHWNWKKTWGWDFPMVAMTAVRLDRPDKAIDALFMKIQTNTYLQNGHNYQDARLRLYLPGNGGVLATVALMCAGYDGCETENPGIPKDGTWKVKWEGLSKMP